MIDLFKKKQVKVAIIAIFIIVSVGIFTLIYSKESVDNKNINTPKVENSTVSASKTNSDEKSTKPHPEVYVNKKIGLKMTFPSDWFGKYYIIENGNKVLVCFKAKNQSEYCKGILFEIEKKTSEDDEGMLDTISGRRYLTKGNTTYIIGSPTDVGFPPENPEFNDYKTMRNRASEVIDTLENIN